MSNNTEPNYQLMYRTLWQCQTQALELLKAAQQKTEEIYIATCGEESDEG